MIDLLPIFPCNLAKEPLSVHGFKSARRGAQWKHWPLVGFRTGEASGINVLDIDPSGRDWYEQNFDALPQTRAHQTQRGLHLLFKHAPGLRSSAGKIAEGIDIRADGGYAIYWPTTGLPIEDWPICEWPDWLLEEARSGLATWYPTTQIIIPDHHDPVLAADCTAALWEMNAEDWRGKHDEWFELLIACKYVGISLADFVEWCVSDPRYADDADKIARKWHSVVLKHGGAFWREVSRRKIRIGKGHNESGGVPNGEPKSNSKPFSPSR
jgi:Bifunctional DNA primase/polymerase, N-terminal